MGDIVIEITDDGDEDVYFIVDGMTVYTTSHGPHGWDGMTGAIEAVTAVANALNVEVNDKQGIA